ncbi:MAG: hypothetical protein LZ174_10660, partial [Thaumarchaeota archaeon]|nr:hypothetical protein [Candidatus Geocrenenecus arthurdayi]
VKTYSRIQLRIYPSMLSNERVVEVVKHQSPRMYKCWEKITLDEIMDLADMPRPERLKTSSPPVEEVGEVGYEPGA